MKKLLQIVRGYYMYSRSPKGRYEWKYYILFLGVFTVICWLLWEVLEYGLQ